MYGINPVYEALRAGRGVRRLYVLRDRRSQEVERLLCQAKARGVEVAFVDKAFFRSLPKGHQSVVAEVKEALPCSLEDLYEITEKKAEEAFYFIVDGIEDPHNLGAVLRVADAAGAHGVVLPKRKVARGPTVTKAAAGADLHLCICRVPNIKHCIREFQTRGIQVIALEASGEKGLWEVDLKGPLACVLGSEGRGIRKTVLEACDMTVRIPLFGEVTSLNVSTAAAVFAFELRRQRTSSER